MATAKIANTIVETLASIGVERVYGVPGDSLNGITDAIRTHKAVSWVHTRNEEAAAFAAGAEAHLTGNLAVCAGSCGPGNTHLINGLFDCQRNRVPVLAIAAQVPSKELGSGYFQETKPEQTFKDCSFYCESISHPSQIRILEIAIRTALARRGVAVVVISGDTALQEAALSRVKLTVDSMQPISSPEPALLERAAQMLNESTRTTILAGAGCQGSHPELLNLAEKLQAPIVHSLRGKEFIQDDNPYDVGMTGLLGFTSGHHAMESCQLLLMLGTDFPYQQFYPAHARVIQVDLRGEQIGRRTAVDLALVGTVKDTLIQLLPLLNAKTASDHLSDARAHYKRARKGLDDLASDGGSIQGAIHPQYVTATLDRLASEDAIFTCDVGTPTIWAARYLSMNGKRRLLGSFNHGSMANALPQAIGAQLTFPNRQVISMSGDGGLAMLLGELLTLRQANAPVKIILYRNDALSFVELEMKAVGVISFGTDLVNPDFAKLADACGIFGQSVDHADDLERALRSALDHPGPALVSIKVAKQELSMPPTIDFEQAKGFGIYLVKAMLNGRGNEILDLLKTNIREIT